LKVKNFEYEEIWNEYSNKNSRVHRR
jgi:hypothetical protein